MIQMMGRESQNSELENPDCPCTWDCERHGKCNECQEYHKGSGGKTYCGK